MPPEILAALFGLASAVFWGGGDFSGGLATRRATNVFGIILVAQVAGLVLLLALALITAQPIPPAMDLALGGVAGIFGSLGLAALYRALSLGQMGVAAPITAVLAAGVPVLFGAFLEGLPGVIQFVGFGVALLGVWLLARPQGDVGPPKGLGLALLSGLGFGIFFIIIDQAGATSVYWPLITERIVASFLMLGLALAGRGAWWPGRKLLPLIALSALLDVGGNAFFVLATQEGRLDSASVLSSLYPVTTVLLARIILKERVTPMQAMGIAAALGAVPLIVAT